MILRQTLLYLPAQLVGPLFQFVAVLAWTHLLEPSEYGLVALVFAAQELAFLVCMSWWTQYTVRYLPGMAERSAFASGESAAVTIASLLQVPFVGAVLIATGHIGASGLVAAALVFTLGRTLGMHLGDKARALGDIPAYTLVQMAAPVLGFGLGLGLHRVWPGVTSVLAGFATVQIAILPILARRLAYRPALALRIDRTHLRTALRYGGPLLAAGGFGWVCLNGIRIVVEQMDGLAAVGQLSVGWNLGQRLIGVVAMLVTAAAFPLAVRQAAHSGEAAAIAQIGRTAILVLGLLMPATIGLVMLSGPFTQAFVGAEFRDATLAVLPVAALAAAIRNARVHNLDQIFLITERPGFLLGLVATEAAATMILCAIGLHWGGLAGACLGALAATIAAALACWIVAIRRHGFTLPAGPAFGIVAATALMAATLRFGTYPHGLGGLALQVLAGAAVYLAAAALLLRGFFTAREPAPAGA